MMDDDDDDDHYYYVPFEETCFLCLRQRPLDANMQFFPFIKNGICSICWSNYIKYGHRIKQLKEEEEENNE